MTGMFLSKTYKLQMMSIAWTTELFLVHSAMPAYCYTFTTAFFTP